MANSVDPDQMPLSLVSDLNLHCLLRPRCPNTFSIFSFCSLNRTCTLYYKVLTLFRQIMKICHNVKAGQIMFHVLMEYMFFPLDASFFMSASFTNLSLRGQMDLLTETLGGQMDVFIRWSKGTVQTHH